MGGRWAVHLEKMREGLEKGMLVVSCVYVNVLL
jgi:hypothetical protein